MIRAFVALPVPDAATGILAAAQAGLAIGRPVPPQNFHVTLAFVGKHPEPVVEDLHDALSTIRQVEVDLSIDSLGLFGEDRPRALYAAVAGNPALTALRKKVRQAAHSVGIPLASQKFVPHVTLARFGDTLRPDDIAELHRFISQRMSAVRCRFRAESFVLYRSHLKHTAPVYEPLAEYDLAAVG